MEQKIRVLMCGSDLKSVKGGMVTVVKNYLAYPGWKKSKIIYTATHTAGGKTAKTLWFVWAYLRIWLKLCFRKADVVHLHMAERGSFYRKAYIVRTCRFFHVPVIIHHHGAEFGDFYSGLTGKKKTYVRKILEEADCNLVLSDMLRQKLLERAPDATVYILHNAVEVRDQYSFRTDADRIIMLGCQGRRKGSYDLLDAIAAVDDRLPDRIKVWMCGDEDVHGVTAYVRQLGLSERIAHVGWVDGAQKDACLEHAMMHVLPSYREALPMSILETMGRGIPNISTDIASIPEVIRDGENGFLMKPGDVERLQEKILELVENEALRNRFGQEGYRLVKTEFSLESCAARLEQIYGNIVKGKEVS